MADIEITNRKKIIAAFSLCGAVPVYVTFHFGFFFSCLFPISICVNIKQIKEECIKKLRKIQRHTNHIVLHVYFFFLSCIPIKKYSVVSLGMGFDRLTACSWCGAKWVKQNDLNFWLRWWWW